ncbi:uncharacterized protein LOC141903442 [Tubulanus polymorphus]|uniref:uncharacterized protein LOC141903442 n=1 Tax=Tubulanus polymorphus TaxID=672921 RepID=UPI003DA1DB8F
MRERQRRQFLNIGKLLIFVSFVLFVGYKLAGILSYNADNDMEKFINRASLTQKHIETMRNFTIVGSYFSDRGGEIFGAAASIGIVHALDESHIQQGFVAHFQRGLVQTSGLRAVSPAMTWFRGELVVVLRIRVNNPTEDEIRLRKYPDADVGDNFLYMQKYDANLRPVSQGRILVPPEVKGYKNILYGRAINPTLFVLRDTLYMSLPLQSEDYESSEHMFIWNLAKNTIQKVIIQNERLNFREKNWAPFVVNDTLHFVYTFDPSRVIACLVEVAGDELVCKFVHQQADRKRHPFSNSADLLRGATPFELYRWPYYISVARSRVLNSGKVLHAAHLVIMRADYFHIVYTSAPLNVNSKFIERASKNKSQSKMQGFLFAGGLVLENDDSVVISLHMSDVTSFVVRFRGLAEIFRTIIAKDAQRNSYMEADLRTLQQFIEYAVLTSKVADSRRGEL